MRSSITISGLTFLFVVLSILVGACDGDEPTRPGGGQTGVAGTLTAQSDGAPLAGVKVALVKAIPFEVVGAVTTTDSSGSFAFQGPPAGDYYLFIYPRAYLAFDALKVQVEVRKGQTVRRDLSLLPSGLWSDTPPRATGIVRDGGTGEPIAGAYVSSAPGVFTYGWQGITLPQEDITDGDGRYTVQLQMFIPQGTGALVVSAPGFDTFFADSLEIPMAPDTVTTYDVNLKTGGPVGNITGRVIGPDSAGVSGVPVGIALTASGIPVTALRAAARGEPDAPDPSSILGKIVMTGSDGRFTIADVTPGLYVVVTGFLPDDGYGYADDLVSVVAGQDNDAGDLPGQPVLAPVSPKDGAKVSGPRPILVWEAAPDSAWYTLNYGTGHILTAVSLGDTTQWQFPTDLAPGTKMRWGVRAHGDGWMREFDAFVTFEVGE
jgi:hypothetical protein